ncbi:MAG: hypothetical protein GY866_13255 [Proteobacteria bacterium]|nr:hypothetical protein [Pseudomonadota bacterium]
MQVYPGTLVAPGLVYGGTDSKHYLQGRIHGTDERLGIANYIKMVQYYTQLVINYAGNRPNPLSK